MAEDDSVHGSAKGTAKAPSAESPADQEKARSLNDMRQVASGLMGEGRKADYRDSLKENQLSMSQTTCTLRGCSSFYLVFVTHSTCDDPCCSETWPD